MSRDRRLRRSEWQYIRQLAAEAGKPYGFSADDILDEARRLVVLSDAEQDAECADALAQAQVRGDHGAMRILTAGCAAVRSCRSALMTGVSPVGTHDNRGIPCSVNHASDVR